MLTLIVCIFSFVGVKEQVGGVCKTPGLTSTLVVSSATTGHSLVVGISEYLPVDVFYLERQTV